MTQFLIQNAASFRIDEIYRYTLGKWGAVKAESYISGLFEAFEKIGTHEVFSRPLAPSCSNIFFSNKPSLGELTFQDLPLRLCPLRLI